MDGQISKKVMKKGPFKHKKSMLAYMGGILGIAATLLLPAEQEAVVIKSSFFNFPTAKDMKLGDFPVAIPTYKFGFVMESFHVEEDVVKQNQTLGGLLSGAGLNARSIQKLVESKKIDSSKPIDLEVFINRGIIKNSNKLVKILGNGEIKSKLQITELIVCSKSAIEKIEKAGGTISKPV